MTNHGKGRDLARGNWKGQAALLAALFAALLLAQQLLSLPGDGRLASDLQNAAHTPWFFLITLLAWRFLRHGMALSFASSMLLCACGGLLLAVFTELIQFFTRRDASAEDIGRDLLGMAAALMLATFQRKAAASLLRAAPWALLSAVTFLAGFHQVIETLGYYRQRAASAPLLVDAQAPPLLLESLRGPWRRLPGVDAWPAYRGRAVLEVSLDPGGRFPGLRVREPFPDWNPWELLVIEAFVEGEMPLPMTVRVETARDRGMESAVEIVLTPGPNRLEIPIRELIESGNDGLPPVRNLLIFSPEEQGGRRYYLGSVRLE